ncbi:MAG: hypothetical protein KKH67_04075 [candidate division Zixibacteria bacterium]|nr:hypothetical protein [candidate division Zixibacteria bacterium]MBU1469968.1 hypothetical protein [candidate division Zixibacteria bacterium]
MFHPTELEPEEINELFDFNATKQNVTVRLPRGKRKFEVFREHRPAMKITRSRLDKWEVPD